MADYLVRVIGDKYNVIGMAGVTTELVDEARRLHGTSRTASAALGRALTGGLLMGSLLKRGQRVALKFEGGGPLKKILVEADPDGTVRGFVGVPEAEVPLRDEKLNVAGARGREGTLTVIKDLGLKEPYRGIVKLLTGEIAEDIAYYYAESEQIPSALGLGVFVRPGGEVAAAGGFLVQSLPPSEERDVDRLIENIRKIPSVTDLLRQGKTPEDILVMIFSGMTYHLLGKKDLSLRCTCSRERVERVLITLGSEELKEIIAEKGETDVTCEFCRTSYHFTRQELEGLASSSS
ncbi:MAG: Hsp33 family molecular chaperone HslO [Deltaproteobacteria bacterium]|nr:Hsp33 family molecular chaperone HslO [Deltaproteobacteria bacterium]